jgi:hypothetical protein
LGASDAGSRWLFTRLTALPDVTGPAGGDLVAHFFDRFATEQFGDAERSAFATYFPRRAGHRVGYQLLDGLAYPWMIPLLARAAPEARVVVIVRDPLARLHAGLAETLDNRRPHVGSYLADAVDRGFYGQQLLHLFASYPQERVHVVQYEQCVATPREEVIRASHFLGLDPTGVPPVIDGPNDRTTLASDPWSEQVRARLRAVYADDVSLLAGLVPALDLSLWPAFSSLE